MTLKLTAYQARLLYMHLCAKSDAGAETFNQKELDALEDIILKLNKAKP